MSQTEGGAKLPTMELTEEDKAKIRAELEAGRARAEGSEGAQGLENAIQLREQQDQKDSLGLDLDFDVKAFITEGVIVKRGIQVSDKVYVDMRTLTTKERMLAEAMVRDKFGNMKLDSVYLTAIEAAMMAVSITRINNQKFDNPDVSKSIQQDKENAALYEHKRELFEAFLDSSNELVTMISVIYKNLESVQSPGVEVIKKS